MLKDTFGLVYCDSSYSDLKDLTVPRSTASVPFGGRYRVIDFALSNMVNSGIMNVGVITERNYSSLMDHLSSGAPWDLNRKNGGLAILPPFNNNNFSGMIQGTVDSLSAALDYVNHQQLRYCIVHGCGTVFNTSYMDMVAHHIETKADITCLYCEDPPQRDNEEHGCREVRFMLDENQKILDLEIANTRPLSNHLFLECMVIDQKLLVYLINEARAQGAVDFFRDILKQKVKELNVQGFRFDGYVGKVATIESFLESNLDMLNPTISAALFNRENPIYTKVKDEVPALYRGSAIANNCCVADGCIVEGTIENCILFRSVSVAKGARLKNCVIMQGCDIQENVELENVILDKNVVVRRSHRLIGTRTYPVTVRKEAII